jgi:hypothetical protein
MASIGGSGGSGLGVRRASPSGAACHQGRTALRRSTPILASRSTRAQELAEVGLYPAHLEPDPAVCWSRERIRHLVAEVGALLHG